MSSSTCKEQCKTCKCIVKERIIDAGKNDNNCKEDNKCKENKKDCSEVYKQLGTCISECLLEKCREKKKKSKADDC